MGQLFRPGEPVPSDPVGLQDWALCTDPADCTPLCSDWGTLTHSSSFYSFVCEEFPRKRPRACCQTPLPFFSLPFLLPPFLCSLFLDPEVTHCLVVGMRDYSNLPEQRRSEDEHKVQWSQGKGGLSLQAGTLCWDRTLEWGRWTWVFLLTWTASLNFGFFIYETRG